MSEWYVSTTGSSIGNGSQASPWDFETAIGTHRPAPSVIQPGDTIWMEGGTYTPSDSDNFISQLNGTPAAAIWIRNLKTSAGYTGQLNPDGSQRVIINGNGQNAFNISGAYTTVEGLESADSTVQNGNRYLVPPNPLPAGWTPSYYPPAATAMELMGPGNRAVHCVAHDNSAGIYSYAAGNNCEIYGCISFYNGYIYGSQGLGHGFYLQNTLGNKWIGNNFAGDNVDNGFQIYGSGGAAIGFVTSHNASYNSGSLAAWQYNLVIGSAAGTSSNIFDSFLTFFPLSIRNGYVTIGQYDPISEVNYTDSVFVGGYTTVGSEGVGSPATFTGNKLVNVPSNSAGAPSAMVIFAQFPNQNTSGFTWNNNEYFGGPDLFYIGQYDGINLSNGSYKDFASWQTETGFDANSTFNAALPTDNWTYVLPDKYTTKRANIIIYNWNAIDANGNTLSPLPTNAQTVAVDLSGVLSVGDPFTIQDAQNWFGPPVLTGVYGGGTVNVPMINTAKPQPWGLKVTPPHTAPVYGTFVVFSSNSADIPQPAQPPVPSAYVPPVAPPPSTPPPPPVTVNFIIGQSVAVSSITSPASVRSQGNETTATILGTEPNGAVGVIVDGPNPIPATGTAVDILWSVQFSDLTGWVWQSLLVASGAAPAPVPTPAIPNAPSNLTATEGNVAVTLNWTASTTPNVTYDVWRGSATGQETSEIATGITVTKYTDNSVATGSTYYYVVRSNLSGIESPNSNEVMVYVPSATTPAPPVVVVPTLSAVNVTLSSAGALVSAIETFSDKSSQNVTAITTVTLQPAAPPPAPVPTPPPTTGGPLVMTPLMGDANGNWVLPRGIVGTAYSYQLLATGGTAGATYKWVLAGGSLPPGLSVSSSGLISGTPTSAAVGTPVFYLEDGVDQNVNHEYVLTIGN